MVYGLIIPRSYNDYYSRSDPQAIQAQARAICDSALNATSVNPIQNKPVTNAIGAIHDLIPAQATRTNKLADKEFVNSSVSTNTANYISDNGQPFTSVADLEAYSGTLTNNDYAFVISTDSAGNTVYNRYKYNASTTSWAFEYALNNSSFTAEQWAAINSGITAALVQQFQLLSEPIGVVKAYAGSTTPAHYLPCDGAAVSRETYSALYAVIGTTYGAGDGSTTFNVPDLRETVPVGAGENTTNTIANHDIYTVGQFKDDQNKAHHHTVYGRKAGGSSSISNSYPITDHGLIGHATSNLDYTETTTASGTAKNIIGDAGGDTAHGKQLGVNYIIKYE